MPVFRIRNKTEGWRFLSLIKRNKGSANILLLTLSVLAVMFALEGGTRLLIYFYFGQSTRGQTQLHYFPHLVFVEAPLKTDVEHKNTLLNTIQQEFKPPDSRYRIVVIGGSTARGLPEDMLANAFERLIDREVEVINLSGPAYIINQELVMAALYGINLRPDLIITVDGANDIVNTTKTGEPGVAMAAKHLMYASQNPVMSAISSLALRSQFINSIVKLRQRMIEKRVQESRELVDLSIRQYLQGLRAISLIAKSLEAQHILVLQPYVVLSGAGTEREGGALLSKRCEYRHKFMAETLTKISRRLSEFRFQKGFYYVDGTKAFKKSHDNCFVDEVHLTPTGYGILIDFIISQARLKGFSLNLKKPDKAKSGLRSWPDDPVSPTPIPQLVFSP